MKNVFGYDLPPGCTQKDIDDQTLIGCDFCSCTEDDCTIYECDACLRYVFCTCHGLRPSEVDGCAVCPSCNAKYGDKP